MDAAHQGCGWQEGVTDEMSRHNNQASTDELRKLSRESDVKTGNLACLTSSAGASAYEQGSSVKRPGTGPQFRPSTVGHEPNNASDGSSSSRWTVLGIYSTVIFPWLCDLTLDRPFLAKHRQELLAEVGGEILEIGAGTGLNLPHYPPRVRKITTVDPNPGMNKRLQKRIKQTGIEVDQRVVGSESLPFEDGRFDFVVSTLTLCSTAEVERAVREVYRVLKPGGRFVFLEHGISPDPKVRKWQGRLNSIQRIIGDGCRLDLDVRHLINARAFRSIDIDNFYLEQTPRTHGFMYRGQATK